MAPWTVARVRMCAGSLRSNHAVGARLVRVHTCTHFGNRHDPLLHPPVTPMPCRLALPYIAVNEQRERLTLCVHRLLRRCDVLARVVVPGRLICADFELQPLEWVQRRVWGARKAQL
eukprot:79282-Prymnesium_polylepis.2